MAGITSSSDGCSPSLCSPRTPCLLHFSKHPGKGSKLHKRRLQTVGRATAIYLMATQTCLGTSQENRGRQCPMYPLQLASPAVLLETAEWLVCFRLDCTKSPQSGVEGRGVKRSFKRLGGKGDRHTPPKKPQAMPTTLL